MGPQAAGTKQAMAQQRVLKSQMFGDASFAAAKQQQKPSRGAMQASLCARLACADPVFGPDLRDT